MEIVFSGSGKSRFRLFLADFLATTGTHDGKGERTNICQLSARAGK